MRVTSRRWNQSTLSCLLLVVSAKFSCAFSDSGHADIDEAAGACNLDLLVAPINQGTQPGKNRMQQHKEYVEAMAGRADKVAIFGDATAAGLQDLFGSEAASFGISETTSEELLWRLRNGEYPMTVAPEVVVLMVGTSDVLEAYHSGMHEETAEISGKMIENIEALPESLLHGLLLKITDSISSIITFIHQRSCRTQVFIMGLLPISPPEDDEWPSRYEPAISEINSALKDLAGRLGHVHFVDCQRTLLSKDGQRINDQMVSDGVNLSLEGYKAIATCMMENPGQFSDGRITNRKADSRSMGLFGANQSSINRFQLRVGGWSECSDECGGGIRQRELICTDSDTEEPVNLLLCSIDHLQDWELEEPCNISPCDFARDDGSTLTTSGVEAHWVPGPWSPCEGLKMCNDVDFVRDVVCVQMDGNQVEPEHAMEVCGALFKPLNTAVVASRPPYCLSRPPGTLGDQAKTCMGHGFCATDLTAMGAVDVSEAYDCICKDGWSGPMCNVSPECISGVVDRGGVCCESGILGILGDCCTGADPVVDNNGQCCSSASKLDACGNCAEAGKEELVKDITGTCCEADRLSALEICCLKGEIDDCGVCGGDSSTCMIAATLQVDLPPKMQTAAKSGGANMEVIFSSLVRDIVQGIARIAIDGSDIKITGYSPTSQHQDAPAMQMLQAGIGVAQSRISSAVTATPQTSVSSNSSNSWEFSVNIIPPSNRKHGYPLTAEFFGKVWNWASKAAASDWEFVLHPAQNVSRTGLCGNLVCEVDEGSENSPQYCPRDCANLPTKGDTCPSASMPDDTPLEDGDKRQECSGRGVCVPLSSACKCFAGYTGEDCTLCMDGFIPVPGAFGKGTMCVAEDAVMEAELMAAPSYQSFRGVVWSGNKFQRTTASGDDSGVDNWIDWSIKYLPFVVVIIVVLLAISFIAIGSLLYVGRIQARSRTNRQGLLHQGINDQTVFVATNPSFGPDGVRMEDFCDDADTQQARFELIQQQAKMAAILEQRQCVSHHWDVEAPAPACGDGSSDESSSGQRSKDDFEFDVRSNNEPGFSIDTVMIEKRMLDTRRDTSGSDEVDYAVLDMNYSNSLENADLGSMHGSQQQGSSRRSNMSVDVSVITRTSPASGDPLGDTSLDLSALHQASFIPDLPDLAAEPISQTESVESGAIPEYISPESEHIGFADDSNPYAFIEAPVEVTDSEHHPGELVPSILAPELESSHLQNHQDFVAPAGTESFPTDNKIPLHKEVDTQPEQQQNEAPATMEALDAAMLADSIVSNASDKDGGIQASSAGSEPTSNTTDDNSQLCGMASSEGQAAIPSPNRVLLEVERSGSNPGERAVLPPTQELQDEASDTQGEKAAAQVGGRCAASDPDAEATEYPSSMPKPSMQGAPATILTSPCYQDMEREPQHIDVGEVDLPCRPSDGSDRPSAVQGLDSTQDLDSLFAHIFDERLVPCEAPDEGTQRVQEQPALQTAHPGSLPQPAIPNLMDML